MSDGQRIVWMRRLTAAGGLLLLAMTWKLWTPQTEFPQIPVFRWLVQMPGWVDWIALASVLVSLLMMGWPVNWKTHKLAPICFLVGMSVLVMLNQHRLQPWCYLLAIYCVYLVTLSDRDAIRWMQRTVASIYIFSAISKLDYQFVFTVGRQMGEVLSQFIGLNFTAWPVESQVALVLALPIGELLVGGLVLVPKWRRLAGTLAVLLHGSLLLVLGPWGLNHQPGVLVWNLFFIGQAWVLLASLGRVDGGANRVADESLTDESVSDSLRWLGRAVGVFVLVFPMTTLLTPAIELPVRADHWLAWEVYAPRSSRASQSLVVGVSGEQRGPTLNQRSLQALGVPVYPGARFQAACWRAIQTACSAEEADLRNAPVVVSGVSDRLTGWRQEEALNGEMAWSIFRRQHWINTIARQSFFSDTDAQSREVNRDAVQRDE